MRLSLVCGSLLAAFASGEVVAQANPFYVGAAQAVSRESNIFRVSEAQTATSDTISTTSLLGGVDQPIGRQRLFADAEVRAVRFSDNSVLNHTGGSLLAGVDLSALDAFAGRLAYSGDKSLARYGDGLDFSVLTSRVLQTTEEFSFRGQYGLVSLLSVEGGFVRREFDLSTPSISEFEQDAFSLGLKYRPSEALTLGAAVRRTDGEFPFALGGAGDSFRRDDLDLTAVWVATGASTLSLRLSRTRERHEQRPERDVAGSTGAVNWTFKPTGKSTFLVDYLRDTGAESSFAAGGSTANGTAVDSSPLSTTLQLRADYEATAKVQFQAFVREFKRELVNGANRGKDTLLETRLGVAWTPLRSVRVGCSVGREKRSASSNLSYAYSANATQCSARFKTQ